MSTTIITPLLLLALWVVPQAYAQFSGLGCFSESDISSFLSLKGSYTYQSTGYCQDQCSGDKVAALLNGQYCYCGLTVPLSSLEVSNSKCDTPCQGYNIQTCGGDGYFYVYINDDVDGSTMASSSSSSPLGLLSSSKSASSTDASLTSQSPSSLGGSPSTLSSPSASKLDSVNSSSKSASKSLPTSSDADSTTKSNSEVTSAPESGAIVVTSATTVTSGPASPSIIEVTTTISSSASSTANSNERTHNGSGSKNSLSGGAIAGIVIGVLAGVALLAAIAFLFWKRRREEPAEEEDFYDVGGVRQNGFDGVNPNPYIDGRGTAGALAASGLAAHDHHNSNTSRSYSSNNDDVFFFDNMNSHRGDDALRPPDSEEYGRRRLSDGSLPDMVQRNPGSLKVVN